MKKIEVTWFTPTEELPPEDKIVLATINGRAEGITFSNAVVELGYVSSQGWYSPEYDFTELTVIAWCDLEPYGGQL